MKKPNNNKSCRGCVSYVETINGNLICGVRVYYKKCPCRICLIKCVCEKSCLLLHEYCRQPLTQLIDSGIKENLKAERYD